MLELDGRVYLLNPRLQRVTQQDVATLSGPAPTGLGDVVTDYGAVPQMREVCGKARYIESLLAKDLRDVGEAIPGSAIITDHQHRLDDRCSMVLYQVMERSAYKRYSNLVESSDEPCLLHSLGRLYTAAATRYKRGTTLILFAHHEVIDAVAVENGSMVAFRRLPGMINGEFRSERIPYMVDQINALQQQLRSPLEQLVVYQLMAPASGPLSQWPREVSERLQLPMVEAPSRNYTFTPSEGAEEVRVSHILPLISKLNFANSSAPRRNRMLAATVALMPVLALVLLVANAAVFATYALATIEGRSLDARIQSLQASIDEMAAHEQTPMPEYVGYLQSAMLVHDLRAVPGFEAMLAEIAMLLNDQVAVELDVVRLTYPGDSNYRRQATVSRDAVATATGDGIIVELAGRFQADSLAVMDAFDRISRRLGGSGYTLLDSSMANGPDSSDFLMRLERRIDED